MPATSSRTPTHLTAIHDQEADIIVIEFHDTVGPFGIPMDLLIFHGGRHAASCAAWRVRATRQPFTLDAVASA